MARQPNKTYYSVNFATEVDTGLSGANGTGSFPLNLAALLYDSTGDKKAFILNNLKIVNSNAQAQIATKTVYPSFNAAALLFASKLTPLSDLYYNGGETMASLMSSLTLRIWNPLQITSSVPAVSVVSLTNDMIQSIFNFGSTNKLQLGLELEYTNDSSGLVVKRYADVPLTGLVFSDRGITPRVAVHAGFTPTKTVSATTSNSVMWESNSIPMPATAIESLFSFSAAKAGTEVIIRPIVYVGPIVSYALTAGKFWYLTDVDALTAMAITLVVPTTPNTQLIGLANTDNTNNLDTYTGDYGWVGEFASGTNDTSITITVI